MIDMPNSDVQPSREIVSETTVLPSAHQASSGPVTYTLKVLSSGRDPQGNEVRTVLFQRASAREAIEISVETDAHNLLAEIPDLLEAALQLQGSLRPAGRTTLPATLPLLGDESRLVRRLAEGDHLGPEPARRQGVLRLIGVAYRVLSSEGQTTVARPGAPPRARGWGALRPHGRRGRG